LRRRSVVKAVEEEGRVQEQVEGQERMRSFAPFPSSISLFSSSISFLEASHTFLTASLVTPDGSQVPWREFGKCLGFRV